MEQSISLQPKKSNLLKHNGKIGKCKRDKAFNVCNVIFLTVIFLLCLYPLIFILSASFTHPSDVLNGKMFVFPTSLYFEGYKEVITSKELWIGLKNSLITIIFGSLLNLAVTFSVGYALSRKDFYGRKFFFIFFLIAMFFSGGLIPTYKLVAFDLGMKDSLLALIIPSAVSVWNIILAKTYFQTSLSEELFEAAKLDGCSNIKFFIKVALPLAKPIIAVILLYNIVGRWNSYFDALIYLDDPNKFPLQLIIYNYIHGSFGGQTGSESEQAARYLQENMNLVWVVISSIPMLVIYPFVQKHFVKGVMVGSLKG